MLTHNAIEVTYSGRCIWHQKMAANPLNRALSPRVGLRNRAPRIARAGLHRIQCWPIFSMRKRSTLHLGCVFCRPGFSAYAHRPCTCPALVRAVGNKAVTFCPMHLQRRHLACSIYGTAALQCQILRNCRIHRYKCISDKIGVFLIHWRCRRGACERRSAVLLVGGVDDRVGKCNTVLPWSAVSCWLCV